MILPTARSTSDAGASIYLCAGAGTAATDAGGELGARHRTDFSWG